MDPTGGAGAGTPMENPAMHGYPVTYMHMSQQQVPPQAPHGMVHMGGMKDGAAPPPPHYYMNGSGGMVAATAPAPAAGRVPHHEMPVHAYQAAPPPAAAPVGGAAEMAQFQQQLGVLQAENRQLRDLLTQYQDSHRQLQARNALTEAQCQTHWELLSRMHDMLVVFDMAGIIVFVSPMCHNILQFKPEELFNRPLANALARECHAEFEESIRRMMDIQMNRALAGEELISLQKFMRKDGSQVWLEGKGQAWQRGDVIEFVMVYRELLPSSDAAARMPPASATPGSTPVATAPPTAAAVTAASASPAPPSHHMPMQAGHVGHPPHMPLPPPEGGHMPHSAAMGHPMMHPPHGVVPGHPHYAPHGAPSAPPPGPRVGAMVAPPPTHAPPPPMAPAPPQMASAAPAPAAPAPVAPAPAAPAPVAPAPAAPAPVAPAAPAAAAPAPEAALAPEAPTASDAATPVPNNTHSAPPADAAPVATKAAPADGGAKPASE